MNIIVALTGVSAATGPAFVRKAILLYIGCYIHWFNMAVQKIIRV